MEKQRLYIEISLGQSMAFLEPSDASKRTSKKKPKNTLEENSREQVCVLAYSVPNIIVGDYRIIEV